MMKDSLQKDIVQELQKRIVAMQGSTKSCNERLSMGLGPIEAAFPEGTFPTGAIHEFVSTEAESAASTSGFLTGLLNRMMRRKGFCLWISSRRQVFPPALKLMGIAPEAVVFIDLQNDKDVLWAVEEALRCEALIAVVGELKELTFAQSRRLQLAIEQSGVTGFIHRVQPDAENATACVARWRITPLAGILEEGMPGVGFPKWNVELTKVRNGRPGSWKLGWTPAGFQHVEEAPETAVQPETTRYA
jgi:protein ImuA